MARKRIVWSSRAALVKCGLEEKNQSQKSAGCLHQNQPPCAATLMCYHILVVNVEIPHQSLLNCSDLLLNVQASFFEVREIFKLLLSMLFHSSMFAVVLALSGKIFVSSATIRFGQMYCKSIS